MPKHTEANQTIPKDTKAERNMPKHTEANQTIR